MQAFFEKNIFFIEFAKFDTIRNKNYKEKLKKDKNGGKTLLKKKKDYTIMHVI